MATDNLVATSNKDVKQPAVNSEKNSPYKNPGPSRSNRIDGWKIPSPGHRIGSGQLVINGIIIPISRVKWPQLPVYKAIYRDPNSIYN